MCGWVLWYDLTDSISIKFKPEYDKWLSDEYLTIPYEPWYSKDPFWDAMRVYEWMSMQTKVAWVKYVERALALNGCSLSKDKQWAILYYFVPEFRSEIARALKMEWSDYGVKNYTFDEDVALNYCTEFYNCITHKSGGEWQADTKIITSGTPEDIKTNCKEFFQTNYREWQAEEKKVQNLQISRLWNDKYLNATTEESPYDVVKDLGTIWELSYEWAQKPITPIFYDLPVFAKSKDALLNSQNWCWEEEEVYGGEVSLNPFVREVTVAPWEASLWVMNTSPDSVWTINVSSNSVWVSNNSLQANVRLTSVQTSSSVKPLSRPKWITLEDYDTLLEWLWAYKINNDESAYYWSLCKDEEAEPEPESESLTEINVSVWRSVTTMRDIPESVAIEYQELVDYMMEAVDSYTSISEEKMQEIESKAWEFDESKLSADSIEETAAGILKCYKSCVWLSIDQQFTCMAKCSCGEIKSPIFNPEVNPGMWPIFMIRYCAVPSVNPRYFYEWSKWSSAWTSTMDNGVSTSSSNWGWRSGWWRSGWWSSAWWSSAWWSSVWWSSALSTCEPEWWSAQSRAWIGTDPHIGWTTMKAMEKWINEILWVVEKLAREWRLGIWTQQYNFLDSTTKMMDVADTFSFTIWADQKKITKQPWESSEEYKQRMMKMKNNNWMEVTHVSNPISNPATRNYYLLVSQWEIWWDITSSANADATRQAQWYLDVVPWFIVDQSENSNAARYATISELFSSWMDEQWDFWAKKVEYLKELDDYAKALYAKKW